jgi:membrane dipeptidase
MFKMYESNPKKDLETLALHKESTVTDFHCDTLKFVVDWAMIRAPLLERRKLGERNSSGHLDIPRLIDGGVDCQVFAVFTAREPRPQDAAILLLDAFYQSLNSNMDKLAFVTNLNEIKKANGKGKVAGLLSMEGGEPLLGSLAALRMFYKLGIRAIGLTWSNRNELGNGSGERRPTGGLTDFGIRVLEEANKLGMIVDVSHLNDEGFWDVAELNKGAFIASHSNCRTLCDNPRNLTDEMIKTLAKHDGVMGMNFLPFFLLPKEELSSGKRATVKTLCNHIDYVANLVGVDHIGIGSDYDGIPYPPDGLEDASKMPNITYELVERGYSDKDVKKILGGNFLRVIDKVLR